MSKIRWISTSPAVYKALDTKDENALYFLTSGEIYKGSTPFTQSVILVDEFPTTGALGKIYVLNSTLEGKVYNGTDWKTVIQPVLSADLADGSTQTGLVTAEAVKKYVTDKVGSSVSGVSDVAFDKTTQVLKVTKDGTTTDVAVDGLVKSATYKDNALTLNLTGLDPVVVNFPADNFVKSGVYDDAAKTIVLTLQDNSIVTIPASDLVDIYTGGATDTATVDITGNVVKATVKVSATTGNKLSATTDGLYVSNKSVEENKADELVKANADGTLAASGVKVGGSTLAETTNALTLATEAAVDAIRTALQNSIGGKVSTADIATSIRTSALAEDTKVVSEKAIATAMEGKFDKANIATTLNEATPSDDRVISEKALLDAISWTILS